MKKTNLIFIVLIYMFTITFLFLTLDLPSIKDVSTVTGPATWPLTLLILMLVLNTIALISVLLDKKSTDIVNNPDKNEETDVVEEIISEIEESEPTNKNKQFIFIFVLLTYLVLLNFTGFLFSTAIFIIVCSYILGMKNKYVLLGSSVIATLAIYGLFNNILSVPLP